MDFELVEEKEEIQIDTVESNQLVPEIEELVQIAESKPQVAKNVPHNKKERSQGLRKIRIRKLPTA